MNRNSIAIILSMLLSLSCLANSALSLDPRTREALASLNQQYTESGELNAQFEQNKFIQALPRPLRSTGQLTISREKTLEWVTETPLQSRLLIGREGLQQITNGEIVWEMSAQSPVVKTIAAILLNVLSGDLKALESSFDLRDTSTDQRWSLELIPPATLRERVKRITLSGKDLLDCISLEEQGGDRTEISIRYDLGGVQPEVVTTQCGHRPQ